MRRAASVVPFREVDGEFEILVVTRAAAMRYFPGFCAFPGGGVDDIDETVDAAVDDREPDEDRVLRACAVREVEEETSIRLEPDDLLPLTRLETPLFSKLRFDTQFYLARTDEEPRLNPAELSDARWLLPREAVDEWRHRRILLTPPTLLIIEALVDGADAALETLGQVPRDFAGSGRAIPWEAGYEVMPLHCAPLPPQLPTNAFLVGWDEVFVVDPGPTGTSEREHLLAAIEHRLACGATLRGVILTHHHTDHVAGLDAVLDRFGCEVWAHPLTGERLDRRLDHELLEGSRIPLGTDPSGRGAWELIALFTPGHADDHLVLHDPRHRSAIVGDLVSTLVSMYVGSPGGHVGTYLASVERLRELDLRVLYPSHGMPTHDVGVLLDKTIRHRHDRLAQIAGRLGGDRETTVEGLATAVYGDVDPAFREFYLRAARGSLEYLVETGRALRVREDVFRAAPGADGAR